MGGQVTPVPRRRPLLVALAIAVTALSLLSAGCQVLNRADAMPAPTPVTDPLRGARPITLGEAAVALRLYDDRLRGNDEEAVTATEAVSWMTELGLLNGMHTPVTSPAVRLTRGDVAVILHRFAGSPYAGAPSFPDVERAPEAKAVSWLRDTGLTTGTSPTSFSPNRRASVTEFEIFLDRLDDHEIVRMPHRVAHTIIDEYAIADPFVVPVDDGYLLYATQDGYVSLPIWHSPDLETWEFVGEALPELPTWVEWGRTWAPDVFFHNGRWEMFFSARSAARPIMCIGRAVADDPLGPFVGDDEPLVCQHERGGAIDPRRFVDVDGRTYLLWKSDDNARQAETVLWSQELDDDLRFIGPRVRLLGSDDAPHLGPIVESPQLVLADGAYILTYSAGDGYYLPTQFIGTAVCEGPLGPCVPSADRLIASSDDGPGPGEHSLFVDHDGTLQVAYGPFHARHADRQRILALAAVDPGRDGLELVLPLPSGGESS